MTSSTGAAPRASFGVLVRASHAASCTARHERVHYACDVERRLPALPIAPGQLEIVVLALHPEGIAAAPVPVAVTTCPSPVQLSSHCRIISVSGSGGLPWVSRSATARAVVRRDRRRRGRGSFDDLSGLQEHRRGDSEPECPGSFEV